MQLLKRTIFVVLIIAFSGIQFASFIDDPHHFFEPDPDCFLCMVSQTSVYIHHIITLEFTPDVIIYVSENILIEPYSHQYFTNLSTRAPPLLMTP
jgi:hypothetical protein